MPCASSMSTWCAPRPRPTSAPGSSARLTPSPRRSRTSRRMWWPWSGCSANTTCGPSWAPPRWPGWRSSPPPGRDCRSRCTPRVRSRPRSPGPVPPGRPRWARWSLGCSHCRTRRAPPTLRTRSPSPSVSCGAAGPPPGSRPRSPRQPGEPPMIASVRGTVAALGPDGAVVEVGGVGLAVSCSPGPLARLRVGQTARLATSLVVREDSLTLYGFADDDERALFELLQTANGVGPKLAQTMLAVHSPRELRRAIATSDYPALTQVPGIGRKGAERIVVELREGGGSLDGAERPFAAGQGVVAVGPWRDQLAHALAGLGFSGKEAAEALEVVAAELGDEPAPDVSVLLRKSIQLLGRAR